MKEETALTVNSVKRNRSQNQPKQSSQEYECKKCGRKHKPHECPAYGKLKGCLELKLTERIDAIECSKISKNELIKQYKDVFIGTGEFPDELYHITLKDNAIPVIHPPRRVPQALQPKLKETLDKLEKEKIVSKVNKPTDWVQSLVIVEKTNGNLR
ncbi:hypothetical protein AVEN_16114-1 [Araneus ventricosus]|uniref:Uncharacterized protein n=1 Tax=Araneus ventricosus TaxID=182803 RepID=A0A4Y2RUQ6_ARAVE|nr:hypothetical protein AVEN_16114-1 [Araneus ventricosus]